MAENEQDQTDSEGQESKQPRKPLSARTKLIILITLGVLAIGGSVFGTLYLLGVVGGGESAPMEEEMAQADPARQQAMANKPIPAMYFPIKPAFVVSFPARGKQRYLQVEITVMTRDSDIFVALQTHMPLIKNRLVLLLGGQVYEEMQTDEGKELLRQKALQALNEIMQQELGKGGVEEVLFTNFVMQ